MKHASLAATLLLTTCVLPGEPSGAERIQFTFDFPVPYRVPLAGTVEPAITITAGGQVLSNPSYRLESLDGGVLHVDASGRGLEGLVRGTASVRVVYQTATGAPDTTFTVRVVVSRVAVTSASLAFTRLADTSRLTATAFDAKDAAVASVKFRWSSAEPHVASVDTTGLVRAVNEGSVAITAMAEADSVTGSSSVSVTQVANAVRMVPKLDTLRTVGRSAQFLAVALDDTNGVIRTAKPHWTSSNESVARIDSAGLATTTGAGTTKIVARVGAAADTAVLVVAQVVRFVVVSPSFDTLKAIADTARVTASVLDSLGSLIPKQSVTWATGDAGVATVDPTGLVRATKNGVVLVTASSGGQSAFATILVHQEVAAARLSQENVALTGAGDTVRLNAVGLDRNAYPVSGAAFVWRSDFQCVATVDAAGLVTARGQGSAGIVATLVNGGPSAKAAVTVAGSPSPCPQAAIAFQSPQGIEVMSSDGSQRFVLIGDAAGPAWSPDGTKLAFSRQYEATVLFGGATCAIYTTRVDGSELRRITTPYNDDTQGHGCDQSPAWSPDGRTIAFATYFTTSEGYDGVIYLVNADGSNPRRLGDLGDQSLWWWYNPTWSADGTKLAFERWLDIYSINDIAVANADGTGFSAIPRSPASEPAWSPDGSELAFTYDGIELMHPDGTGRRSVTHGVGWASSPAWSPDGAQIVFVSGCLSCVHGDIYVVNRDGTGLRQLTATPDISESNPAWRPIPPLAAARRSSRP